MAPDKIFQLPILLHMWEDLSHLKNAHASKKIHEYNTLYKKLQRQSESEPGSEVWARLNFATKNASKVCRIAFESFVHLTQSVEEDGYAVFQKKFISEDFKDFSVRLFTRFISEVTKESTRMFFTETGGSYFDDSVRVRDDPRFPGKKMYCFPALYQVPVLSVEVDQDLYVTLSKLEFKHFLKGVGMSITRTLIYYAKAPEKIDSFSIRQWLPTNAVTHINPVVKVLEQRQKYIESPR